MNNTIYINNDHKSKELIKCRENPFYFIYNYVKIPEIGGYTHIYPHTLNLKMKRIVKLILRYHSVICMASRQLGKALSVDTPLSLPNGEWKILNDIVVGDMILGADGKPTTVINITDVMYNHNCYNVEFANANPIIADEEHLWKINSDYFNNKIMTTKEIIPLLNTDVYIPRVMNTIEERFYIKSITQVNSVPVRCLTVDNTDHMFLCGSSMIPTHNSTIAACMIAWALLFYQESYAIILNMKQTAALKNLAMVKFIIMNLPPWMINAPNTFKSKSDLKTKLELFNNSRAEAFYPATSHSSSTIARSLTSAILYVDEGAHIKDMKEIWGSAQPILFKAREQAASRGYPYFQFVTSTPNGTLGSGEWFFDRWTNAVDSELLFDREGDSELWTPKYDIDTLVNDPNKNGFTKVQYHWREDPTKTEEWYAKQKRELSDDRQVNQELDLKFVGTTHCIFSDTILAKLNQKPIFEVKPFIHASMLEIYESEYPLNNKDYYIIGVDTAESLDGAYNAIQVFRFSDFKQIAELQVKLSSFTHWGQIVHEVFQWLYKQVGDNIILSIENNSIGRAPIEYLLDHTDFPYNMFMFKQDSKDPFDDKFGVKTTGQSKPVFLGTLVEIVNDFPDSICSSKLIGQFGSLHRSNSGTIKSSTYVDLAMAASFCAYTRKYKALDILPKIHFTSKELEARTFKDYKQVLDVISNKPQKPLEEVGYVGDPYDDPYFNKDNIESTNFFSFF